MVAEKWLRAALRLAGMLLVRETGGDRNKGVGREHIYMANIYKCFSVDGAHARY